jgi:hypothetical protein
MFGGAGERGQNGRNDRFNAGAMCGRVVTTALDLLEHVQIALPAGSPRWGPHPWLVATEGTGGQRNTETT